MVRSTIRATAYFLAALTAVAALFFYGKMRERERLLDGFITSTLTGVPTTDRDSVVRALALAVYQRTNHGVPLAELPFYERLEAISFFNVTTGSSLKHGFYGVTDVGPFGPCGTMSRVLLSALWRLHIPARKLQLLTVPGSGMIQHTMVEYQVGERWQVISPSDSAFVWHNRRGQVATLDEIRSDSTVLAQVHRWHPWWPASFDHASHIRWEKLPAPLRRAFHTMLGEQRYESALTPQLYDEPRRLMFLTTSTLSILFAAIGWLAGRGRRRVRAPGEVVERLPART